MIDSMTPPGDPRGVASTSNTPYSIPGPTSPQSSRMRQSYVLFPAFTLESGVILHHMPLAYKTWGTLDPHKKDNVLVLCHALTGSADVEDWWGPLLGPGKVFDPTRFFIVCANVLGSPYGSASPCTRKYGETEEVTKDWQGQGWWGPEFPATTVRDDVTATKQLLDYLGVEQIAAVIGGSMGGMAVLEWPLLFPIRFPPHTAADVDQQIKSEPVSPYIRAIIPIAIAARHSAWCISWVEAQRQTIYSDPNYDHGYYDPSSPPRAGLSAARMAALLTYRSRDSFESRFGRRIGGAKKGAGVNSTTQTIQNGHDTRRSSVAEEAVLMHNEGNQSPRILTNHDRHPSISSIATNGSNVVLPPAITTTTSANTLNTHSNASSSTGKIFSAQSYLRYQGDKFVKRFDANCYVHLTRKMDTHDVARGRAHWGLLQNGSSAQEGSTASPIEVKDMQNQSASSNDDIATGEKRIPREGEEDDEALARVLDFLSSDSYRFGAPSPQTQIVSIESDGLFAPPEQELLHQLITGSSLVSVKSADGHDGFLLEFEQVNHYVESFLKRCLIDIYKGQGVGYKEWHSWGVADATSIGTGGEKAMGVSEVDDVTRW